VKVHPATSRTTVRNNSLHTGRAVSLYYKILVSVLCTVDCPRSGRPSPCYRGNLAPLLFIVPMREVFNAERVRHHFKSAQSEGGPLLPTV
jgi:hypothetical protein